MAQYIPKILLWLFVINSTVVICHARVSMLPLNPAEYAD